MSNFYETLEVSPQATPAEIEKSWRRLIRKHHPDLGGDIEMAKSVNQAHDVLADPGQRSRYDAQQFPAQPQPTQRPQYGPSERPIFWRESKFWNEQNTRESDENHRARAQAAYEALNKMMDQWTAAASELRTSCATFDPVTGAFILRPFGL